MGAIREAILSGIEGMNAMEAFDFLDLVLKLEKAGGSQRAIAKMFGMGQSTIHRYLKAARLIHLNQIRISILENIREKGPL